MIGELILIFLGKPVVYKILAVLDFNNVRKRMSVIVKDEKGWEIKY